MHPGFGGANIIEHMTKQFGKGAMFFHGQLNIETGSVCYNLLQVLDQTGSAPCLLHTVFIDATAIVMQTLMFAWEL